MRLHILILLIAIVAMVVDTHAGPALYTAINAEGVSRLVNKALPALMDQARNTYIPDVKDGHHHLIDISIPELSIGGFNLAADPSGVIVLDVHDFHTLIHLRHRYKRKIGRVTTDLRADISKSNFQFHLQLTNHEGQFALAVSHFEVHIGDASVKTRGGGIVNKFIDAIMSLFKSQLRKTLQANIRETLHKLLAEYAHGVVVDIPLRFPIADWAVANFALEGPIQYADNRLVVGFNGEVHGADGTGSGAERHDVGFNPQGKLFDVSLDTFIFNSLFSTFFKLTRFNHVCTREDVNGFSGVELTSTAFAAKGLPAMKTKFPDADLTIQLGFTEAPLLSADGGQATAAFSVYIDVLAGTEKAFRLVAKHTTSATVTIADRHIIPQLTDMKTTLSVAESKIGDISLDVAIIQTLVNFANDIATGVINNELLHGIPLPMSDKVVLNDVSLVVLQNGFAFGCDVDFNL